MRDKNETSNSVPSSQKLTSQGPKLIEEILLLISSVTRQSRQMNPTQMLSQSCTSHIENTRSIRKIRSSKSSRLAHLSLNLTKSLAKWYQLPTISLKNSLKLSWRVIHRRLVPSSSRLWMSTQLHRGMMNFTSTIKKSRRKLKNCKTSKPKTI